MNIIKDWTIRINLIYPGCEIISHVLTSLIPGLNAISDINIHEILDFLGTIENKPVDVDLEFCLNNKWQQVGLILDFADHVAKS